MSAPAIFIQSLRQANSTVVAVDGVSVPRFMAGDVIAVVAQGAWTD